MKANKLVKKISNTATKVGFVVKKHSPEILAVAGTVGVVVSTVMACKATTKLDKILEEPKDKLEQIKTMAENGLADENVEYTKEDAAKDRIIVMTQAGINVVKLYAPAVTLGVLSLTSLLASNHILRKRFAAVASAYAVLNNEFKDYRNNVISRFGKEVDNQLRFGTKAEKITETSVDEDGKEKKEKKIINVSDPNSASDYRKFITRSNPCWRDDEDYMDMFFRGQQAAANDMLREQGHLTLNQIYDMFDIRHTKGGFVVGWIFDEKNPTGDNFIHFDIQKTWLPNENGDYEKAYSIDFNVDGVIYDKI